MKDHPNNYKGAGNVPLSGYSSMNVKKHDLEALNNVINNLQAENERLKKELETALLKAASLADEKVALSLELESKTERIQELEFHFEMAKREIEYRGVKIRTKNLYAELGELVYKSIDALKLDLKASDYFLLKDIINQIQESETK